MLYFGGKKCKNCKYQERSGSLQYFYENCSAGGSDVFIPGWLVALGKDEQMDRALVQEFKSSYVFHGRNLILSFFFTFSVFQDFF